MYYAVKSFYEFNGRLCVLPNFGERQASGRITRAHARLGGRAKRGGDSNSQPPTMLITSLSCMTRSSQAFLRRSNLGLICKLNEVHGFWFHAILLKKIYHNAIIYNFNGYTH